jgi:hypothetical protein
MVRVLRVLLHISLVLACYMPWNVASSATLPPQQPQEALRTLTTQVESGQVQSIQIVYFPTRITSDPRMTPERLKTQYIYRITIRRLPYTVARTTLLRALKRTTVVSSSDLGDIRWGATFTLLDGTVRAVYLDAFGRFGEIDNLRATFHGGLFEWFRQLTAPLK